MSLSQNLVVPKFGGEGAEKLKGMYLLIFKLIDRETKVVYFNQRSTYWVNYEFPPVRLKFVMQSQKGS